MRASLSPGGADLVLNVYYVLTLNGNGTIGVVDPLFGYGGTKLLAEWSRSRVRVGGTGC